MAGSGVLGDDDLFGGMAGAAEAMDRAEELVAIVRLMSGSRGTSAHAGHEASLQHALAGISDASFIRTTRVDISFPVSR